MLMGYNQVRSSTITFSSRWVESPTAWINFSPGRLPGTKFWTGPPPVINLYKEVRCAPGEVMTGARFYQVPQHVDDEHVDALCSVTNLDMSNISGPYWAGQNCGYGEIMVGLRMYGYPKEVDDERVDVLCANLNKSITQLSSFYVEPNSAYAAIAGFKAAQCPANYVMTGVNFYKRSIQIDDEHVNILCSNTSTAKPPVVNIKFR